MLGVILLFLVLGVVYILFIRKNKDGFANVANMSCRKQCSIEHPEAARMYMDADNDIASTVMNNCMSQCRKQCGSCR
jgi:hypothetical protein